MKTGMTALAKLRELVARQGLEAGHPPDVMAEVRSIQADPGIEDPTLLDLTGLPFCTIDEVTSKDLDQALFIEAADDGWTVWYAIADAAWFVRPGFPLYREALARGATYYLPGLMIPMLPAELSEGLVSLNPNVDRRAMVFRMRVGRSGELEESEIVRARIHSQAKLDYGGVQAFLDGLAPAPMPTDRGNTSLELLREVGLARMQRAHQRGVVSYRRTEVDAGIEGTRFVAVGSCRHDTERYNEQISLMCNIVGAEYLMGHSRDFVEPIYRVHDAPGDARMAELREQIRTIAALHHKDPGVWLWREDESLSGFLERLPQGRVAQALHRQAIVANHPGRFQSEKAGHHGVGAEVYGRFSAPMREVVGVFLHKEVWEEKTGVRSHVASQIEAVVERANTSKRLQGQLTGQSNRLILDQMFAENPGPWSATIMGITRAKVHIQLDEPPIDVKVYLRHLESDDALEVSRDGAAVVRRRDGHVVWRVGDAVSARVKGPDQAADRWALELAPLEQPREVG